MDKLLYRPREAALLLGMSKTALYGLIRTNRIRSIKDGKFRILEVVPKEKTIFPPACKFASS